MRASHPERLARVLPGWKHQPCRCARELVRVIPNIERSQVKAKGLDLINQIFEKTLRRAKSPASHQAFLKGDQAAEEFLRVFESLHLPLARLSQPLLQKQEETTVHFLRFNPVV